MLRSSEKRAKQPLFGRLNDASRTSVTNYSAFYLLVQLLEVRKESHDQLRTGKTAPQADWRNNILYGEVPPRGSTSYTFIYTIFDRKGNPGWCVS